jgi:hypothetical protein
MDEFVKEIKDMRPFTVSAVSINAVVLLIKFVELILTF